MLRQKRRRKLVLVLPVAVKNLQAVLYGLGVQSPQLALPKQSAQSAGDIALLDGDCFARLSQAVE
jgi:hypothetical protein